MNRIDNLFAKKSNDILSVYFTAGYPHLDDTTKVIESLENNGIDLIEIGIPFSDPMADGAVIQASANKALQNGMSLELLFQQLINIRPKVSIPLVLMGYLNPIMQFGFEHFCKEAKHCGIDGIIIPDLPYDQYIKDYKSIADDNGIHMIMLITPETSQERIKMMDESSSGFIYMVSSASVTGAKSAFGDENINYFKRVNLMALKNPRLIGFGISNKETFDAACNNSSGAIVGSKFVSLLTDEPSIEAASAKLVSILRS